jgi:tight adherence protein B
MEILFGASCGVVAWACAFLLAGARTASSSRGDWARRLTHGFRDAFRAMGGLAPISTLSRVGAWKRAARQANERLGLGLAADEDAVAMLVSLAAALGLVLSLAARSPIGMSVAACGLALGVPAWDAARARAERLELARTMPDVFRTMAMAMGSGETLAQAVEYLGSHGTGPAAHAFARASLRLRCGESAEEALGRLSQELHAPGVGLLTTALLISQRTGSPLRSLFERAAALVERQGELERMLSVKTAQVRLSVRMVSALPIVLVVGLSLISPDFQRGVLTPVGFGSLAIATLMDVMALLIIRRLMKGVL